MAITLDGTNGITTPDLESSGPVIGTTGTFSGNVSGVAGTFSGAVQASGVTTNLYPLVSETAKAFNWNGVSTNTFIDFTSIPSWVKRITVMFDSVSYSTTGPFLQVQIGDSGGVETTGYTGAQTLINSASASSWQTTFTAGFNISSLSAAADTISGHIVLTNISGNVWVMSGVLVRLSSTSTQMVSQFAGVKTLSATLDRVRVTTSNGTDTFDAGTVNILYE